MIFTAPPSSPQVLTNRVFESDTNVSRVEVTWEPPDNHSKVNFYHYQVVINLEATNYSCILYNTTTTNTTAVLSIDPLSLYSGNVSFSLSVINYCGEQSTPVVLVIDIGEFCMVLLIRRFLI